jgi:DMSO/TMAO reductase YedYZ molybdopterin-dependent catalytic subunit
VNLRRAALVGLLAGALDVAVGEIFAAALQWSGTKGTPSPVLAIGSAFVDLTPPWLKDFATSTFGTNDKGVLLTGMGAVLVLLAMAIGVLAGRNRTAGLVAVVVLGAIAALAVVTRPSSTAIDVLPAVVGAVAGMGVLAALLDRAADPGTAAYRGHDRRAFLRAGVITGAVSVLAGGGAIWLGKGERSVQASADAVLLPAPAEPAPPVPVGADLRLRKLTPYVTSRSQFYRIDTALVVPRLTTGEWRLRLHGMVEKEVTITYDQLLALPLIERYVTLSCVSNDVGGDLIGNARWLGYPLNDLLAQAKPTSNADMVLSTSIDGFTAGSPLSALTDGRDAMVAIAMNGKVLPQEHGFPARLVVPGLYGYVSATKWVIDLEVTRFDQAEGYWTPRGWSAMGPIKTESRIDVPGDGSHVTSGPVAVAGVAWAVHRGVSKVEVRVDDGGWVAARLADDVSIDTWRQWVYAWPATSGRHRLQVRATDGTGAVQTSVNAPPPPNGASGYDTIHVTVD